MNKSRTSAYQNQRGAAMVIVLLMSSLLLGMMATGLMMARNATKDNAQVFMVEGQVGNIAQAGLQDAVAWFKRHQPVKQDVCKDGAFNPAYNVDPELSDTDDTNCPGNNCSGLVRDIQIKDNLYGRYIVKKQPCTGAYKPGAVHDITVAKGKSGICPGPSCTNGDGTIKGEGAVWYLESEGILYSRHNFQKSGGVFVKGPGDLPNRVLRKGSASVEISQLTVNVDPAPLTTFGTTGSHSFGSRCRLIGMPNAITGVKYNGVVPNVSSAVKQLPAGMPGNQSDPNPYNPPRVFSVTTSELRGMADNVYTSVSQMPNSMQKFSITFLDGNFTFDTAKPLAGGGLLFVNGNLTLNNGSNSLYSGVIYVTGTLTLGKDNHLAGAVIARNVTCNPPSGYSTFEYNSNLITTVRQKLALYRENNLTHSFREY